jgi:uncharacterized protein (DUF1330 family)
MRPSGHIRIGRCRRKRGRLRVFVTTGTFMHDHIDPTKAQFAAFRELGGDGAIHMLNLIRLRDQAVYEDGRVATGREAYRAYGRDTEPIFRRLGGRQFWIGTPELTVIGPSDERWDIVFIAEYPNPAAFVEMLRDPQYREAVKHRQAAVADSRLIRLRPRAPGSGFGEF